MSVKDRYPVSKSRESRLHAPTAVGFVYLLWVSYTVLQTLYITLRLNETPIAILEFIPGILAILVLLKAGFSGDELFLRFARPSWKGLFALLLLSLTWPFILLSGQYIGWDWGEALVQGAGGLSQELFFRAALLPALLYQLKNRPFLALCLHTVMFAIWHGGAFLVTPVGMIIGPIMITCMSVIAGMVWGWQTMHDRTVVWAMTHHSLLWVVGSMFLLGPLE